MSFDHFAWAMRHANVETSSQRLVLLAIADQVRAESDHCWPSQETLAKTIRMNPDTVSRVIKQLESMGLVKVKKRFNKEGKRVSNLYYLPSISLKAEFSEGASSGIENHPTQSSLVEENHPTLSRKPSDSASDKQGTKSNKGLRTPPISPPRQEIGRESYSEFFETFWKTWPRGKGGVKAKAYASWLKLQLDNPSMESARLRLLTDVTSRTLGDRGWREGFVPHMVTYLNGGGWTADIDTSTGNRTNGRAKTTYDRIMEASERNRTALREDIDAISDNDEGGWRFGENRI